MTAKQVPELSYVMRSVLERNAINTKRAIEESPWRMRCCSGDLPRCPRALPGL